MLRYQGSPCDRLEADPDLFKMEWMWITRTKTYAVHGMLYARCWIDPNTLRAFIALIRSKNMCSVVHLLLEPAACFDATC